MRSSNFKQSMLLSEIKEVENAIDECIKKRDYATAETQQLYLDQLISQRDRKDDRHDIYVASKAVKDLAKQQSEEEMKLKRKMTEKMNVILREANTKLSAMRKRHKEEIEMLDKKFSNPRFGMLRFSPDVAALFRAENYYVKNRDFKMALAVKGQIISREQCELAVETENSERTVQSKMDAAIKRQQSEMMIFHQNLEAAKNHLKKETSIGLQTIYNKYSKLRHDYLFRREHIKGIVKMPPTDGSVSGVYKHIDDGFYEVQKEISSQSFQASPRKSMPARLRRVPKTPSPPSSPKSNCASPRNRRVARAFQNSIRRSLASTI